MTTTRVMSGLADLTGSKCATLRVERMVSRQPEPKYSTICEQCSTRSTATHSRLRDGSARCLFGGCGKSSKPRERVADVDTIAAQRLREEREASERRMAVESEGYERPDRYAPTPSAPVMTSREVAAARERRELEAEEQRRIDAPRLAAEAEARERIALAESQLHETSSQLARVQRDQIATAKDHEFVVDPATVGEANAIPQAKVSAWQAAQFPLFLAANPDYYRSDVNAQALTDYIERNSPGLALVSAAQLTAAYKQLTKYGLLTKRPAQAPAKVAVQTQRVDQTPAPAKLVTGPKMYVGRDYTTGLDRQFSQREVDRMSSLEYQRAFDILPSVGQLFTAMSDAR